MDDIEIVRHRFAQWLSLPKTHRVPKTQIEFAEQNGVTREVLSRWKKEPTFKQDVADAGLDWFSSDDISEIVFALKRKAKTGNVQAVKLCLEMAGVITDGRAQPEEEVTEEQLGEMDIAALERLANGAGA